MGNDSMTLQCEMEGPSAPLAAPSVDTIRDVTKLRGEMRLVAPENSVVS
jgi:phenylacetate-CoA ligase